MKKIIVSIALFIMGAGSAKVNAQNTFTPGVRQDQRNEQRRIYQGVRNGELTRREAARLEMQQVKIKYDKRCAKADGVVTPYERAEIRCEQARASRNIYRQKHDGQYRF